MRMLILSAVVACSVTAAAAASHGKPVRVVHHLVTARVVDRTPSERHVERVETRAKHRVVEPRRESFLTRLGHAFGISVTHR